MTPEDVAAYWDGEDSERDKFRGKIKRTPFWTSQIGDVAEI